MIARADCNSSGGTRVFVLFPVAFNPSGRYTFNDAFSMQRESTRKISARAREREIGRESFVCHQPRRKATLFSHRKTLARCNNLFLLSLIGSWRYLFSRNKHSWEGGGRGVKRVDDFVFFSRGGHSFRQLSPYRAIERGLGRASSLSTEFRISFSQGLKYRRFEAFPLIEWNGTSCARKENVNQASGLGEEDEKSPFAPLGGTREELRGGMGG